MRYALLRIHHYSKRNHFSIPLIIDISDISMTIASPQYLIVHSDELVANDASLAYLHHLAQHSCLPSSITIFKYSLSALQALQTLGQRGPKACFKVLCIRSITSKTSETEKDSITMVPGSFPSYWQSKGSPPCPRKVQKKSKQFSSINPLLHYSRQWRILLFGPFSRVLFTPRKVNSKTGKFTKSFDKAPSQFKLIQWKIKTPSSHPLSTTYGKLLIKPVSWCDWSYIFNILQM